MGYERSVNHWGTQLNVKLPGPGYVHLGQETTEQTMEELFPGKRGETKRRSGVFHWIKPDGAHDEAGDCRRYAYAAMQLVQRLRYPSAEIMWNQLEQQALRSVPGSAPPLPPLPPSKKASLLDSGSTAGLRQNWLNR